MRIVLLVAILAISNSAMADTNVTSKMTPQMQFFGVCWEKLSDMVADQAPASKKDAYFYHDAYVKLVRACDRSLIEYRRDGWGDKLKHPQLSGCAEAMLYAYHNKTDAEMGSLTIKWCNGLD